MVKTRILLRFSNDNIYLDRGFSLVEIVVVIAILSTLSAITIPNILRSIKLSRIDEAKILMDSYAIECMNEFRVDNDLTTKLPDTFSAKKLSALGFEKSSTSNCSKFSLLPINKNDPLFFQLDFMIGEDSGTLIKTANPPSDKASLNSCQ